MMLQHKGLQIRVVDSINFMAMPLAKLPSTFGLEEITKGYFPHLFNSAGNQSFVGPIPDVKFYSPDTMSTHVRADFMKWYEGQKDKTFNFKEEILAYCR